VARLVYHSTVEELIPLTPSRIACVVQPWIHTASELAL
jgi:hypothetical protein